MEVAREPAPFAVRRIERSLEEPLAVAVRVLDAASEDVREGEQQQRERHEGDDQHGRERGEEVLLLRGDRADLLLDLEQQRGAVGRRDPCGHDA